jgi:DNA-directed RNA polymerase
MHGTLQLRLTPNETFIPWAPGNDPTSHPRWHDQVELELEMVQRGVDQYRKKVAEARDKGEMTSVKTFHKMVERMVPQMSALLKAWQTRVRRGQARAIASSKLKSFDPDVASFITIRTLLDVVTLGSPGLLSLGRKIGMELEHQARMEAWQAKAPDVFYGVQKEQRHATARHLRRVNIHQFNRLMREPLQWQDWSTDERLHVGLRLIDIAVQATGAFEVSQELSTISPLRPSKDHSSMGRSQKRILKKPQFVVTLTPEVQETLMKSMDNEELRQPQYMPCLMPPKRWEGMRKGGYYTPMVAQQALIRFKASPEQVQAAMDEYDGLEMPRVLNALHAVQEVPWMVNRKVLAVAMRIWDLDLGIAGFPKRDTLPLPPRPDDAVFQRATACERTLQGLRDEAREEAMGRWSPEDRAAYETAREWKREAAKVYHINATRIGKANSVRQTLRIAEKFVNTEFYFPHKLDFRGRMYPIPVYLQPQGNDLSRGLLTFAKGLPVGELGGEWLAINLANHFGADKMSYEGRIAWVKDKDNEEVWRAIAADPIKARHLWLDGTGVRDHWQGLAAVFEWVRFLDEGPDMVSSLPIHIDGTCNGLQHLSAMMRDEVGGTAVNITPNETPHDIYKEVAEKLLTTLKRLRSKSGGKPRQFAKAWIELCGGEIPRSLTKRPVMTTPYGATREAHFGAVYDWLKENFEDKGRLPFGATEEENRDMKKKLVPWLVTHLEDCIKDTVEQGKVCMKWLQDAAAVVAECNQPIIWTTPSGFLVRHFYASMKMRMVETKIDGKRISFGDLQHTQDLNKKDQLQGIAPNFTHSMDASANIETIIKMALDPRGLPITAIHDAYGTCAGAMWSLFDAVRSAFVWVHQNDVLEDFRQECIRMYRDFLMATRNDLDFAVACEIAEETVPRIPPRGSLEIEGVARSDYFFN